MAPLGSQALAAQATEREQDAFFRILLHDDRNSYYVLSSDEGGAWADTPVRRSQLAFQRFDSSSNYYITHNGFSDRRRKLESTRQINALFYDLDCHGASQFECRRLIAEAERLIHNAVEHAILPEPTMVVDSGRGLHLYYVLERSIPYRLKVGGELKVNEKGLSFFHDVQLRLATVLEEILAGLDGIDVDRAVFDHTRVSRIPGTYNAKAGCYARLVSNTGVYCQLSDLGSYRPAAAPDHTPLPTTNPTGKIVRFNRLMLSRLRKVAELQEYRGFACEGTRELMSFVYYNTAVQLYECADAKQRLEAFNNRFKKPLDTSELEGIYNAVDTVVNVKGDTGYYVLSAETLIRLLGLTQQEMEELHFFASKRVMERAEAKRKTKERKEERDRQVCALYSSGDMTQQEVAKAVGCSLRTVCSVLKEAGLTRPHSAPQAASKPVTAQEIRQRNLQMMRQLIDSKAAYFSGSECAILWQPCLWGSALGLWGLIEDVQIASKPYAGPLLVRSCPLVWPSPPPLDEELAPSLAS